MFKPITVKTPHEEIKELQKKLTAMRKAAGVAKVRLPMSEKIRIAKEVCDLYSTGEYTIQSCCDAVSISYYTFLNWAQPNLTNNQIALKEWGKGYIPEVAELYKKALERNEINYFKLLKDASRRGLLLKSQGMEYEEIEERVELDSETKKMKTVSRRITKKTIVPDTGALIFVAKNVDPENFSDTTKTEFSGKVDLNPLSKLSDQELALKKQELQDRLNSDKDH